MKNMCNSSIIIKTPHHALHEIDFAAVLNNQQTNNQLINNNNLAQLTTFLLGE